ERLLQDEQLVRVTAEEDLVRLLRLERQDGLVVRGDLVERRVARTGAEPGVVRQAKALARVDAHVARAVAVAVEGSAALLEHTAHTGGAERARRRSRRDLAFELALRRRAARGRANSGDDG